MATKQTLLLQPVPITTNRRGLLNTTLCDTEGGFLRVFRFPPPIKLTATISLKYC